MLVDQTLGLAADLWPDRTAIIDEGLSISYRDLCDACGMLQEILKQAGVGPGIGVAVKGRNGSAFIAAMLAGIACGATVLPISSQLKQAEIEHIIEDTGLHAVIEDGSGVKLLLSKPQSFHYRDKDLTLGWTGNSRSKPITPLKDAAFIRYTSGTTGNCKGVVLTHRSIMERVHVAQQALNLRAGEGVLWVLPMAYHFVVTILVYLRSGAPIIVCHDMLAQTLIETANTYHAELLYASPMHYRLLAADQSGMQFSSLKRAISTSSAIPMKIAEGFKQRFNIPVAQAYGIIEAGLPLLDNCSALPCADTVGFPVEGFEVTLFDTKIKRLTGFEPGRLAIRGPGMFDAYLNPWRVAADICHQGWFFTGDLARWREDGRLEICGREKSMINVSGNKAFPEEIEAVLNSHPSIKQSRVYGTEHMLLGEVVCAEVVLNVNEKLDVENILTFCRRFLSTYKVPQRLITVQRIHETPSGKVKR